MQNDFNNRGKNQDLKIGTQPAQSIRESEIEMKLVEAVQAGPVFPAHQAVAQ